MKEHFKNLHKTNQEMAIILQLLEEEAHKKEDQQHQELAELKDRIERLNKINQEKASQLLALEEEARKRDDQFCLEMAAMVEKIEHLNKTNQDKETQLKSLEEEARIKENRQHIENAALKERIEHLKTYQEKASRLQILEEETRKKRDQYFNEIALMVERIEHLEKTNNDKNDQLNALNEEKDELISKVTTLRLANEKLLNEKEVLSCANAPITSTSGNHFLAPRNNVGHNYPNDSPPNRNYCPPGQHFLQPPSGRSTSGSSLSIMDDNNQNIPPQQQELSTPRPTALQLKSITLRKKINVQKGPTFKRIPIVKKRPAINVVNGAAPPISMKFGKNKQVPVNVLAAEKPWRPFGTKQHQLLKPTHQINQTPNNNKNTKTAKRQLRLDSPIGSPMFTSTPNNGKKFPPFLL